MVRYRTSWPLRLPYYQAHMQIEVLDKGVGLGHREKAMSTKVKPHLELGSC